jgi:uncharacterized membrane protein YphA (DoxX/SURF4 family)
MALIFLFHGWLFLTYPDRFKAMVDGLHLSHTFRKFLGISEILGAFGLILPGLTKIAPWLTPLAAAGLAIVMAGAVMSHISRKETKQVMGTGFLFKILALIALLRFGIVPF